MLNVRCSGTAPASGAGNGALAVASAAPEGSGTADHTDYANILIRGFILCAGLLEMLVGEGADQSSRGGCAPRSLLLICVHRCSSGVALDIDSISTTPKKFSATPKEIHCIGTGSNV